MKCLICNHPTHLLQSLKFHSTYHACSKCGFISKDSRDHPTQAEEFNEYELHENSLEDPYYVAYFNKFLQAAVFPFITEGRTAFDFGSGPVPVLAQLMERDYSYHYTLYDKFYATDKSYHDKKFDLITATEVMEHIADPVDTFKELATLLNEDGVLAVMTLFPPMDENRFLGWHYMRDRTHVSFYTAQAMEVIADKAGLIVIFCDGQRYTTFKKKTE